MYRTENKTIANNQKNLPVKRIHDCEEQSEVEDKRLHLKGVAENISLSLNEEDECNVKASSSAANLYAALVADILDDTEDGMDNEEVISTDDIVTASVASQNCQSVNIKVNVATVEMTVPSQNQLVQQVSEQPGTHLRVHKGEKLFKCELCGRNFTKNYLKNRHVREVHNNEKLFECELCGMHFARDCQKSRHVKEVHYSEKLFECELCGMHFFRNYLKSRHFELIHNSEKEPNKNNKRDFCRSTYENNNLIELSSLNNLAVEQMGNTGNAVSHEYDDNLNNSNGSAQIVNDLPAAAARQVTNYFIDGSFETVSEIPFLEF